MTAHSSASLPSVVIRTARVRGPEGAREVRANHNGVPGHNQAAVERAVVLIAGGGGIGSQIGYDCVKWGVGGLIICDPEFVEDSNRTRQFFLPGDVGQPKAHALVRNLAAHAIMETVLSGHPLYFEEFIEKYPNVRPDAVVVGVDNDKGRMAAMHYCARMKVPLVQVALRATADGGVVTVGQPGMACAGCYLSDVLGNRKGECPGAPAIIDCCKIVSGYASFALRTVLTGAPRDWNVLTVDLKTGQTVPRMIPRRNDCQFCSR